MKVYLRPSQKMSRAMFRVARALERYAPSWVEVCDDLQRADLLILHCIGPDAFEWKTTKPFVLIQYCIGPNDPRFQLPGWKALWSRAQLVWSYFDLRPYMPKGANFYLAPLGIDPIFIHRTPPALHERKVGIVTSGYANGKSSEAIQDVADAALLLGMPVVHVGPANIEGMEPRAVGTGWSSLYAIPDLRLANLYRDALWVSGLRYLEGFELPAIEGLACGARPILFDREDMRRWYGDHAVYVPEWEGSPLVQRLVEVLRDPPQAVSEEERRVILERFAWEKIIATFWARLQATLKPAYAESYMDVGADVGKDGGAA